MIGNPGTYKFVYCIRSVCSQRRVQCRGTIVLLLVTTPGPLRLQVFRSAVLVKAGIALH